METEGEKGKVVSPGTPQLLSSNSLCLTIELGSSQVWPFLLRELFLTAVLLPLHEVCPQYEPQLLGGILLELQVDSLEFALRKY